MTCTLPTKEVVIGADGSPIWRIQGDGIAVEHVSGTEADRLFKQKCESRGLHPEDSGEQPRRGPSECDEPGV